MAENTLIEEKKYLEKGSIHKIPKNMEFIIYVIFL
jgi:hypothetical protein